MVICKITSAIFYICYRKELKDLEINLLVTRTLLETKPITVEYQITEYGRGVLPLTETLVSWGLKHRSKIRED